MSGKMGVHELEQDAVDHIRNALLIGLASYGEIERLLNHVETMEACGVETPKELTPIHPTGSADTVGMFAEAIRMVDRY